MSHVFQHLYLINLRREQNLDMTDKLNFILIKIFELKTKKKINLTKINYFSLNSKLFQNSITKLW